jgi:hypothetical protein
LASSGFHPWSCGLSLIRRTAVCGPACTVVWQGRRGDPSPYADFGVALRRPDRRNDSKRASYQHLHNRPGFKSTLSRIVRSATRSAIRGWASAPGPVSFDGSPHPQHYGARQPPSPIGGFAAHSIVTELSIAGNPKRPCPPMPWGSRSIQIHRSKHQLSQSVDSTSQYVSAMMPLSPISLSPCVAMIAGMVIWTQS